MQVTQVGQMIQDYLIFEAPHTESVLFVPVVHIESSVSEIEACIP